MGHEAETTLLRTFAAVLCDADAPARVESDLPGFLGERGVAEPHLADLATRRERLLMYRAMVHSRLRGVISEFLPRVAAHLGKQRFRAEVVAFMAERAPHSAYFRDAPGEFLEWADPRWRADPGYPPFLADLAQHEWLDGEIANHPAGGEPSTGRELALDQPVQLDGTTALRRYQFAVHLHEEAEEDDAPPLAPAAGATAILAYRDRTSHKPRFLELTARAATLCERMIAGETLQAALVGACEAVGEPMSDEFLAAMAAFLADLGERGVLLGAACSAEAV